MINQEEEFSMQKVKNTILLSLLLFVGTCLSQAQIGEARHQFSLGGNAGVNINSVMFTPTIKQGTLIGPTFGVTARYISEKYFAMICGAQLEINFSQRGWKEKFEEQPNNSYSRTMNYIEIPFLAHLAFGREDKGLQFFIHLGPEIAFLLSEKEKFSKDFEPLNVVFQQYGKMVDSKFDYGITGGLGVELKTKKAGSILVEGRYYFGLSDFYNNTKKDYFDRSAHSVIKVKLTYLFNLTK